MSQSPLALRSESHASISTLDSPRSTSPNSGSVSSLLSGIFSGRSISPCNGTMGIFCPDVRTSYDDLSSRHSETPYLGTPPPRPSSAPNGYVSHTSPNSIQLEPEIIRDTNAQYNNPEEINFQENYIVSDYGKPQQAKLAGHYPPIVHVNNIHIEQNASECCNIL